MVQALRRLHDLVAELLRRPHGDTDDDLVAHELVHVWQQEHGWVRMWLSYLGGYERNRYELEARGAVEQTR